MIEEELPPNEKFVQGQKIFYPNIYSFKVTTKTLKKMWNMFNVLYVTAPQFTTTEDFN